MRRRSSACFQIFQRFHPNHASGEGMGLATVKRIVDRHHGNVWAGKAMKAWAPRFHFTLPFEAKRNGLDGQGAEFGNHRCGRRFQVTWSSSGAICAGPES